MCVCVCTYIPKKLDILLLDFCYSQQCFLNVFPFLVCHEAKVAFSLKDVAQKTLGKIVSITVHHM